MLHNLHFVVDISTGTCRYTYIRLLLDKALYVATVDLQVCMCIVSIGLFNFMYVVFYSLTEEARKNGTCVLIHCMAGISRSVTLTIAYLMSHFGMSMHNAYQFVKEKRPTISPNLNFMGQLVEFERELELNPTADTLNVDDYLPTPEQERLSEKMRSCSLQLLPTWYL